MIELQETQFKQRVVAGEIVVTAHEFVGEKIAVGGRIVKGRNTNRQFAVVLRKTAENATFVQRFSS